MKKPSLTLFAIVAAAALLAACSKPAPTEEPIRAVKVMTVGVNTFTSGYEFAGEVKAKDESRLGFRVGGKIIKRQAELGQRVKAGQVLAQLDPQDYKLAADAARAQLQAAATNRDLAAADFKRFAALKEQNFISGAELERRETTLKAAQAQVDQAQSQLNVQGNQAKYAVLVADVSGIVTAVEAEPGQVVSAGTPVLRIAADGPRDVVFSVPEDKVAGIKPGMAVKVRGWAQDAMMQAKVREVSASADPATRTYQVKLALDSKTPPPLGATVYVLPEGLGGVQGAPVIKLPTTALRQEGKTSAVWVLDKASMTLKSQAVQVATADGNEAVISSGLQPGMLVVSAGVHVLSPGQKVTIYQEKVAAGQEIRAQAATNSVVPKAASTPSLAASR
ncbi:MAG: efflux RND transporter periplasmic adaptor subunit [Polaromonas sp.]